MEDNNTGAEVAGPEPDEGPWLAQVRRLNELADQMHDKRDAAGLRIEAENMRVSAVCLTCGHVGKLDDMHLIQAIGYAHNHHEVCEANLKADGFSSPLQRMMSGLTPRAAVARREIERLRDRLRVEEEAERLLGEHNDALQARLDAVEALCEAYLGDAAQEDIEGRSTAYDLIGDIQAALSAVSGENRAEDGR